MAAPGSRIQPRSGTDPQAQSASNPNKSSSPIAGPKSATKPAVSAGAPILAKGDARSRSASLKTIRPHEGPDLPPTDVCAQIARLSRLTNRTVADMLELSDQLFVATRSVINECWRRALGYKPNQPAYATGPGAAPLTQQDVARGADPVAAKQLTELRASLAVLAQDYAQATPGQIALTGIPGATPPTGHEGRDIIGAQVRLLQSLVPTI